MPPIRKTSKAQFLDQIARLYLVGNLADSDQNPNTDWTTPEMAHTVCARLDDVLRSLKDAGALTADELQSFYDNL
jgi:hypothetical protein